MTAELERMVAALPPKQAAFLRGLMEGKSKTDAYQTAFGCSRDSARAHGPRMVANGSFREVYERATAEAFGALIDGLKELAPVILRRLREILYESDNEAVVARVIDSVLDRLGIVRGARYEQVTTDRYQAAEALRAKLLADLERQMDEEGDDATEEGGTSGTVTKRG